MHSTDEKRADDAQTLLRDANALRQEGRYPEALRAFDTLLRRFEDGEEPKLVSAAYAGRGVIKLQLGFCSAHDPHEDIDPAELPALACDEGGAIEDFSAAVTTDPTHGWAWAQLGDAHRSFARDAFRTMPRRRFEGHLALARVAFDKALELLPGRRAWLLAHAATVDFTWVWREVPMDTGYRALDAEWREILGRAEAGFRAAIEIRPNYGWAKRFLAYLLASKGEYTEATQLLGEATIDDAGQVNSTTMRSMSLLHRYSAKSLPPGARERMLQKALHASAQARSYDAEDFFATYVHAAACVDAGMPYADGVAREARDRILNQAARAASMAFVLHRSTGGSREDFARLLGEVLATPQLDPEVAAISQHDPVWQRAAALPSSGPPLNYLPDEFDLSPSSREREDPKRSKS